MYTGHNRRVSIDYLEALRQVYDRNKEGKASKQYEAFNRLVEPSSDFSRINVHYSWANRSGKCNSERENGPKGMDIIVKGEPVNPNKKADPAYPRDRQGGNSDCTVPRYCRTPTLLERKD